MATTTLVCKQCNFENEPERVYCHNCGAKLDRSLLPPEASKREDPAFVQERVRRMVKPRNVTLLYNLKNLLASLGLAVLFAVLVVIVKPPNDTPKLSQEAVMDAPAIVDDMDGELQQPVAHRLVYTEDQVNAFLQSSLRAGKAEKAGTVVTKFERAFVKFEDGIVHATTANSLFGLPIYATTTRTLSVRNGVITSQPLGGKLGRLSIPAKAVPAFETIFRPLRTVLDRPLKMLTQMQSVTVHKGGVEMITTPARR